MPAEPHIGTLNETPLHASMKDVIALPGDLFEVPVDGFVVDILRDDLIIEIQTRSFGSMKRKLGILLESRRIRLVHPIAHERWIVKLPKTKKEIEIRRKSPKRQGLEAIFKELVSVPYLIDHPNLEIELVLVKEDEIRKHEPGRAWRRKGWVVEERRLVEVIDRRVIRCSDDLIALIGNDLPATFTTQDIAQLSGWNRRVAQQAAYCLRGSGAIDIVGKEGNSLIYELITPAPGATPWIAGSDKAMEKVAKRKAAKKAARKKKVTKKKTAKKAAKKSARKVTKKTTKTAAKKKTAKKKSAKVSRFPAKAAAKTKRTR